MLRRSQESVFGFVSRRLSLLAFGALWFGSSLLSIRAAQGEALTLEQVLSRAVRNSHDVHLSEVDVKLNKNDIFRKRTDFLPNIVAHMNTEYLRDLTNDQTQVAVVNNTIIPNTTRYQTSFNMATSWNIYDFGARSKAVLAAKEHHQAAVFSVAQRRRDIRLAVIDQYSEVLFAFKNVEFKMKILDLRRNIYVCKTRLFDAGNISKVELSEAALATAEALNAERHARFEFLEQLKELSELTHDIYNPETTEVTDFVETRNSDLVAKITLTDTPDHKFYDREISARKAELEALKRQRYPQVGVYSNFYLYGFNQYRFFQSFKDLRPVTISFGLSLNYPVFDQLKNFSERQRKSLEIERLQVEREKKLWEIQQAYEITSQRAVTHGIDVDNKAKIISQHSVKAGLLGRLADKNLADRSQQLAQEIEISEQELELLRSRIQMQAQYRKLLTMAEG